MSLFSTGDDPFWPITDYADYKLKDVRYVEGTLQELVRKLPQCKAVSPAQFRQWCRSQIDKEAARLLTGDKPKQKNIKPFRWYDHDGICCIPVRDAEGQEHIWKVEQTWIDDIRDRIWPVHIRWTGKGKPFLARKRSLKSPGELEQKVLPAHHTYLWFKYPGIGEGDIACSRARNGDFLDWTNDNIFIPALDGLSMSEKEREFRIQNAIRESSWKWVHVGNDLYERVRVDIDPGLIGEWERRLDKDKGGRRDIMECGYRADLNVDTLARHGYNGEIDAPDKPTRPSGAGPAMDDRDAWITSALDRGMTRGRD
jgi:hypothetical protein